jgi:fructose-specific phosphotransferase system component IIB
MLEMHELNPSEVGSADKILHYIKQNIPIQISYKQSEAKSKVYKIVVKLRIENCEQLYTEYECTQKHLRHNKSRSRNYLDVL